MITRTETIPGAAESEITMAGSWGIVAYEIGNPSDIYFEQDTALPNTIAVNGGTDAAAETRPAAVGLTNGNVVIAWADEIHDGSGSGIVAAVYDVTPPALVNGFQVNTTAAGNQHDPSIAPLADGGFVIVWSDDALPGVRGQRFDANGTKIGSEFVLNNFSVGSPQFELTSVALLSDGRIVFTGSNATSGDYDVLTSIWDPRTGPITGTNAGENLTATPGSIVFGLGGSDSLAGSSGVTLLGAAPINGAGNAAANVITGNAGGNKLLGLGGSDTLAGGAGKDALTGGAGSDRLIGGLGKDVMTGDAGADDFDFNSVAEIGRGATRDVIRDFVHLIDDIDLRTIDANGAAAGNAAFSFLATKGTAFTGAAGELRWLQDNRPGAANDKTIIEGDTNGNRVADFQIQLTGLKTLTAADFVL